MPWIKSGLWRIRTEFIHISTGLEVVYAGLQVDCAGLQVDYTIWQVKYSELLELPRTTSGLIGSELDFFVLILRYKLITPDYKWITPFDK